MELVKGFKDYTGEEAIKRAEIIRILKETFEIYGFEPAETPVVEYEEFVKGENSNDEAVSDIFKLQDKGKRNLALRYEFTFQLKRLIQNKKLPYRRYQIGPVFRDEPVSSNRFRQFTQCDIDIIGSTIKDEAEILCLVKNVFDKLGVKITINVNSRKLLNEILEKQGIKNNKEQVLREIDKFDKLPENEVRQNLKKLKAEKIADILKNKKDCFKDYSNYGEIEELTKYCTNYGFEINFLPSLVRGLSYYSGNVFEVKTKELKETISGGGAYFVNGIESTGIAFGLDRIINLAKISKIKSNCLIISINQDKEAIQLTEKLRKENVPCFVLYGKPSKALDYANSKKFSYVVIIGEDEIKLKKFTLKNMITGKEEKLKYGEIVKKLTSD